MEKLGIEKLKRLASIGIEIGGDIEKALEDGKVSLWEGLGIVPNLKDLGFIIKERKDIKAEYEDLSNAEKEELCLYIKEKFDLKNDKLEMIIEKSLDFAVSISDLITSYKLFIKSDVSLDDSVGGGGPGGDPDGDDGEGG